MDGAGSGGGSSAAGEVFTRVVKPSEVLESLMNDGTFDGLRGKVTAHLKNNDELKQYTQLLVEKSQTLNSPGAENKTRRELFDALRRELEGPVLDRCSKSAWELILSKDGLGKEVMDSVDATYAKLSAQAEPAGFYTEAATPSEERHQSLDKRTPSQERTDEKINGYNSQANGREPPYTGSKRDRDYVDRRDSSRDRDRDERPRNRDRDLYERRDAAREFGTEFPDRSYATSSRDYTESSRSEGRGNYRDYATHRQRS